MSIPEELLEKLRVESKKDNGEILPSDIRQLIGEIDRLREAQTKMKTTAALQHPLLADRAHALVEALSEVDVDRRGQGKSRLLALDVAKLLRAVAANVDWLIVERDNTRLSAVDAAPPNKRVSGDYRIRELLETGRNIWGNHRYRLDEILIRLGVGFGDLSRLARNGEPRALGERAEWTSELKKELGNIIFSTIRWCDDLGFDVTECLALAIEAQRKFAGSGRSR